MLNQRQREIVDKIVADPTGIWWLFVARRFGKTYMLNALIQALIGDFVIDTVSLRGIGDRKKALFIDNYTPKMGKLVGDAYSLVVITTSDYAPCPFPDAKIETMFDDEKTAATLVMLKRIEALERHVAPKEQRPCTCFRPPRDGTFHMDYCQSKEFTLAPLYGCTCSHFERNGDNHESWCKSEQK